MNAAPHLSAVVVPALVAIACALIRRALACSVCGWPKEACRVCRSPLCPELPLLCRLVMSMRQALAYAAAVALLVFLVNCACYLVSPWLGGVP